MSWRKCRASNVSRIITNEKQNVRKFNEKMTSSGNVSNTTAPATKDENDVNETLRIVMDVLLITLTVLLMLSFGCSLKLSHIKRHFAKPTGLTLGLLIHFIVLPYTFYALVQALGMGHYDKVALVVLSTCPSGGISNLFVKYADGDLALGIIITAISNILALAFMPLNLWLFSRAWEDNVVLPYIQTIISLVIICVPVAAGMFILKKSDKTAKWVSMISNVTADAMVLATIGLSSYMYPQMYTSSWKTWFVAAMFTPISFLIGYLISLALRMPAGARRTLGISSGAKSMALCLTIIAISFPDEEYLKILALPELHSILLLVELALYAGLYRLCRYHRATCRCNKQSYDKTFKHQGSVSSLTISQSSIAASTGQLTTDLSHHSIDKKEKISDNRHMSICSLETFSKDELDTDINRNSSTATLNLSDF